MLSIPTLLLSGPRATLETPLNEAASAYGRVTVQGPSILVNGRMPSEKFFGAVDPTALPFAILAYIRGETPYAGKSSLFNGPDTDPGQTRVAPNAAPEEFWDRYFSLLSYYRCNLVRIGAGDSWGTGIMHDAWLDRRSEFTDLLRTMEARAEAHGVWVVLTLAGSAEHPMYAFGGTGSVFDARTSAYDGYIAYARSAMASLSGRRGIAWYDLFNEPDHNSAHAGWWQGHGGKDAFFSWASGVAADTTGASDHPRTMGVAGLGNMFGWGQEDFDLCAGRVPFEIASRHYYASNHDANNFIGPEQWARRNNKPLYWGELANNSVYPLVRYTFAEQAIYANGGQAITSMVLTGTPNYPYTGT